MPIPARHSPVAQQRLSQITVMAPRESRENLEAVVREMEEVLPVVEKSTDHDPTLADAADTQ